jgi:hypothetical protein
MELIINSPQFGILESLCIQFALIDRGLEILQLRMIVLMDEDYLRFMASLTQSSVKGNVYRPLADVSLWYFPVDHSLEVDDKIKGYLIHVICVGNDDILGPSDVALIQVVHVDKGTTILIISKIL